MSRHPATVDELGLQGCLYLWALLTGQQQRLLIAPTKRMTLVVLAQLQEQNVIEVPWPEARWELKLDAKTPPLESLHWRLTWKVYDPSLLVVALEDYFSEIGTDDYATALRLRLWLELGEAESERFFERQLAKHHLPVEWAQDISSPTVRLAPFFPWLSGATARGLQFDEGRQWPCSTAHR